MRNKVRKSVRCNYIIKRLTMERLVKFTTFKLGEIYDRLEEGKGIVTIKDQCALDKARKLRGLLAKIDFPKHKNEMLHDYMATVKEKYQKQLENLISELEFGSKPVYYWEIAQQKYKNDFRRIGAIIDHDTVNLVYRKKITEELLKDYKDCYYFKGYFAYSKQIKKIDGCYKGKKSSRQRIDYNKDKNYLKNFDKYHDDIYRSSHVCSLSDEDILNGIKKNIFELYNTYSEVFDRGWRFLYEENDRQDDDDMFYDYEVNDLNSKIIKDAKLPDDDFYNTMTRHSENFNSDKFRNAVEYIVYIPSKIETLQYDVLEMLDNDINIIKNELVRKKVEWFHECRKNDPSSFSIKLVNLFNRLMVNFKIPVIVEKSITNNENENLRNNFVKDICKRESDRGKNLYFYIGWLFISVNYRPPLDVIGVDCYDMHYYMPVNYNISVDENLNNLEERILDRYPELFERGSIKCWDEEDYPDKCKFYSLVVENEDYSLFNEMPVKLRTIEFQFTENEMSKLYFYLGNDCSTEDLKLIDNNLYLKLMSRAAKIVKPIYEFLGLYDNPDDEEWRGTMSDLEIVFPDDLINDVYGLDESDI